MKNYFFLLVLPLFLFSSCNNSTEDFIPKLTKELKSHNSLHYKINEKAYNSNTPDTTITPYEVWVTKDNKDTIKNGYVWVDNNYRPYNMIYNTGNFYLSIPPKQTTIQYSNYTGSIISDIDWIDVFLKPNSLKELSSDSTITTSILDTIYNEASCIKLVFQFQKNKDGEEKTQTYLIDKKNLIPIWAKNESKNKDYSFSSELLFTEFEFDNIETKDLKEKHKEVLSKNPLEAENSGSENARLERMLHIGDKAPTFEGKFHSTEEGFILENYIGKNIIILDFWYTHCPPCVKSMPYLSELYTEYKDKGLKLFGLNSVDNQPHSLDYLNTFLGKRELSYDVILTKPAVDIMYKINGYPSMYVIDKEGKIAFIEIGFDEEKFKKLKEKVEELCK